MRIALGIQYDGSDFLGWQSQPQGRTLQDTLEGALSKFSDEPISVIVAGRTDTGVHALGQVVHFDTSRFRENFSWVRGVNALLPPAMAVQWAQTMPENFHARFDALERTYDYWLYSQPARLPLLHKKCTWLHTPIDFERIKEAATCLLGEHDFSAFRSSQCQAKNPTRTLYTIDIKQYDVFCKISFSANAFLHHMVRNMMGCLAAIGLQRRPISWLKEVLESKDRTLADRTFPSDGLYLRHVR